jgi:hypothetical protein
LFGLRSETGPLRHEFVGLLGGASASGDADDDPGNFEPSTSSAGLPWYIPEVMAISLRTRDSGNRVLSPAVGTNDYVCLNFGSNLAAAISVRNRGCDVVGCRFQFSRRIIADRNSGYPLCKIARNKDGGRLSTPAARR